MKWNNLTTEGQLDEIRKKSFEKPQLIFKHSTRCSISSIAKSRLEKSEPTERFDFYFLDLLNFRNISNKIAEQFHVEHESPQVLVIKNGESVYDESHLGITVQEILSHAA